MQVKYFINVTHNTKNIKMIDPIDELLEWLHSFDDSQFSCNHRNVIEKIWQIKSKNERSKTLKQTSS